MSESNSNKQWKRVPFDIELAKKIQSGEVEGRIVTSKLNNPVRILCDDLVAKLHPDFRMICAILRNGEEYVLRFRLDGTTTNTDEGKLVIELPEETPKVKLKDTIERLVSNYSSEEAQDAFRQGVIFAVSVDAEYKEELGVYGYKENIPEKEETPTYSSFSKKLHDTAEVLATPMHEFKPFDKVLVRDVDKDTWRPRLYSRKGRVGYCMQDNYEYMQILPYEGHEHLVGTTNNPE